MTEAPLGLLLLLSLAATTLAALLGAGEEGLRRAGRTDLAALATTPQTTRRVRVLVADPRRAAASVAWVRVLLESLAAVALTLVLAAAGLGWWQVLVLGLVLVATVALVLVRQVPRALARRHPQAAVRSTLSLLVLAQNVAAPARLLGRPAPDVPTDDEIREMVERASESGHIEADEREMFRSVLELGDTLTRAVMVPRTEMITLPSGTPLRKAMSLFLRSGYSRVPVVGDSVDDVVGVLYLKDVVRRRHEAPGSDDEEVDGLVRPPVFVPESKPVDDLLRDMQSGASHIALVVDEFGGIAGLVTIEDALEEIVGELTDEHDQAAPEVEDLGDGTLRVPSRLPVDELGELFGVELQDDDVDTAGGLLAKALGKVPLVGSSAEVGGLVLTADRVEGRRRRLATLLVRRAVQATLEDAPERVQPDRSHTDRAHHDRSPADHPRPDRSAAQASSGATRRTASSTRTSTRASGPVEGAQQ